jgi:hypothetical protein
MAALGADLETLGQQGTVEGAAEVITRLEREYRRVCEALVSEGAGVK